MKDKKIDKLCLEIGRLTLNISNLYEKNKKDIRIGFLQKKLNNLIKVGLLYERKKKNTN